MDLSEASEVKTHRLPRSRIREMGKKVLKLCGRFLGVVIRFEAYKKVLESLQWCVLG